METKTKIFSGLTGNQLKIIALIAMTCDHIGYQILPQLDFLRLIGRLAFPIFAYMIAEGARYTKNRLKYFLQMFGLGFICQLVYFFAMDSLYQCVLITFSFSILLIYTLDYALLKHDAEAWILFALSFIATVFLVEGLPFLLTDTDYSVDYGIWGVLMPVLVFLGQKAASCVRTRFSPEQTENFKFRLLLWTEKIFPLLLAVIPLTFLSLSGSEHQWGSFAALLFLALYNGKRGKYKMKNLFYIYYPLHLVVIYGISLIV